MNKKCYKCGETKSLEDFSLDRHHKSGRQKKCKACVSAYYEANKEKRRAYSRSWREASQGRKTQRSEASKEQRRKASKAWADANKERVRKYQAMHYAANKDRIKENARAWREANKERARQANREYHKSRKKSDLTYRLRDRIRTRLYQAIRGESKNGSAVRDLGCSIADLKRHLENQFTDGMAWENWGEYWEIDHIYPLSAANLADRTEFLAVNNWQNLQPLTEADNAAKKDKVTPKAKQLFEFLKSFVVSVAA